MVKRIAILGAGIAGLIAGIILKQQGFDVKVFEKAEKFTPLGGDMPLWHNSLQVLNHVGLYEKILAHGAPYSAINFGNEAGQELKKISLPAKSDLYPLITICRYELLDILWEQLGKESLTFNKKCINILENSQVVTIYFQDGSSYTADILIGADGVNSIVRKHLFPDIRLFSSGYYSLGGISNQPFDIKCHLMFGKFHSGSFSVGKNRQMIFFVGPIPTQGLSKQPSFQEGSKLFRYVSPYLDQMLDNLEKSIKTQGTNNFFCVKCAYLYPLESWSRGRIQLLGEAAHPMGTLTGAATTMIFEGAQLLGEYLAAAQHDYRGALEQYQTHHQPRVNQLQLLEREFAHAFLYQPPADPAAYFLQVYEKLQRFLSK